MYRIGAVSYTHLEAKNEQAQVEERIVKLENMLRKAVIIDESQIDSDTVTVGCTVKVYDTDFEEEVEYTICLLYTSNFLYI